MHRQFGWDGLAFGFGPRGFFWRGPRQRRRHSFQSGDMKYLILKLVKDKPRHGYEVMKELEEQLQGGYSPSPGTVSPPSPRQAPGPRSRARDRRCRPPRRGAPQGTGGPRP